MPEENNRIALKNLKVIVYLALIIALTDTVFVAVLATQVIGNRNTGVPSTTTQAQVFIRVSAPAVTPATSIASAPVINAEQPFGTRLTGINSPLSSAELSVINNASNNNFELAGLMFLNGTLANQVGAQPVLVPEIIVNGKPSVVYIGAISCIFCGENRWAMALALSRFGGFSQLYKGYSSFGDADLPTLYWAPADYNSTQGVVFGNFYTSSYINFLTIENSSPIRLGFVPPTLSYMAQQAIALNNTAYETAVNTISQLNDYQGTPYTLWGKFIVSGADAFDFGNSSATLSNGRYPLTNNTHEQVLSQLAQPNDQFAYTEYAAADLYLTLLCISTSNPVAACHLPAITQIEARSGQ